jgi:hypothetical protein
MEFWLSVLAWAVVTYTVIQVYRFLLPNRPIGKFLRFVNKEGLRITPKDFKGHYIHYDEPMICPLCDTGFYRWQWEEKNKSIPNFRDLYYNHVSIAGVYRLPCTICAVDKVEEIKTINITVHNADVDRWNKLTKAERREEARHWPMSTAPPIGPADFSNRKHWSPEDDA